MEDLNGGAEEEEKGPHYVCPNAPCIPMSSLSSQDQYMQAHTDLHSSGEALRRALDFSATGRVELDQQVERAYRRVRAAGELARKAPLHIIKAAATDLLFDGGAGLARSELLKAMGTAFRSADEADLDDPDFVVPKEAQQEKHLKARGWVRLVYVFEPRDDHSYYRLAADLFCGGNLLDNVQPFPLHMLMRCCKAQHHIPAGSIADAVALFLATATEHLFQVDLRAHMLLMDPKRNEVSRVDPQAQMRYRDDGGELLYWVLDVPQGLRHEVHSQVQVLVNSRFRWSQLTTSALMKFAGYMFELPQSLCQPIAVREHHE